MIETFLGPLFVHLQGIEHARNRCLLLQCQLRREARPYDVANSYRVATALAGELPSLRRLLSLTPGFCKALKLRAAAERLQYVAWTVEDQEATILDLHDQLLTLLQSMHGDLKDRLFLYVPPGFDSYFEPDEIFDSSYARFPTMQHDMAEACKSFACGRWAATVYHCMCILQVALEKLSRRLKIERPGIPAKLDSWGPLIQYIQSKIKDQNGSLRKSKSVANDRKIEFYSEVASQLDFLKDAWRNHVMHGRRHYKKRDAEVTLSRLVDFTAHLAPEFGRRDGRSAKGTRVRVNP